MIHSCIAQTPRVDIKPGKQAMHASDKKRMNFIGLLVFVLHGDINVSARCVNFPFALLDGDTGHEELKHVHLLPLHSLV